MSPVKMLDYTWFGDLPAGTAFKWARFFEGQSEPSQLVHTRMKGNRYRHADGQVYISGAKTAVEIVL